MADEKKISRRSFLKGAAAAGAVAATGIPTKAGPDKLTRMSNAVKAIREKQNGLYRQIDAMSPVRLASDPTTPGRSYAEKITKMAERGEIPKRFVKQAIKAATGDTSLRKKIRSELEAKIKALNEPQKKALEAVRNYAAKNHPNVFIMGSGDVKRLEKGQRLEKYEKMGPNSAGIPVISTPESRAKQKQEQKTKPKPKPKPKPKSAVKGGRGGAGAGRSEEGVHTVFEGPKLVKVEKDYRKGGMVLSRTDNRKKR